MTIEIAQYHYDTGNMLIIHPRSAERVLTEDAIRVSEYLLVDFVPRAPEEIAEARARVLTEKRAKLQAQLAKLEEA